MESHRQVAALPVRRDSRGSLSVLLVTSRDTRRWVIPKGWPWPHHDDHVAAAGEAQEEAGVRGLAHPKSIGCYTYRKRQAAGAIAVRVSVYLLEVTEELVNWPEEAERQRAWFAPIEASARLEEPELRDLVQQAVQQLDV
jgi:8-oxo-dGTP pyrophosphatase MutT (NUDIX family)